MDDKDYQMGSAGFHFGKKEKEYVISVLDSHRLSYGDWTKKFEKLFANEHDSKFSVFSNSGTSALHMALAAMKEKYSWNDGDEVIVPAVTFIATSNIVLFNNMTPVFVDVDPYTYNIDIDKIESAITDKTRVILPVHLFGLPADMDPIVKIAEKNSLRILEDSCECMYATYKGKKVGSFGDVGCFSTYVAHFLVTGIGGLAITSDPELEALMRSYMNHGRNTAYLNINDDKGLTEDGLRDVVRKRFSFTRLGHSMRATELEAAIGVAQFEGRQENIKARREIAKFYSKNLECLHEYIQLPFIPDDREHNFMMYPMVLKNESKWELVNYLELKGIETREMVPLTNQPVYEDIFGLDFKNKFPVAEWINNNGFYVGSHPYMKQTDIQRIVDVILEFFSNR